VKLGSARTIYKYGVHTTILAGIQSNMWSYTAYSYGSGQPWCYEYNTDCVTGVLLGTVQRFLNEHAKHSAEE
jgi:hypothetical protein